MGAMTIDYAAKKATMAAFLRTKIPGFKLHPYLLSTYVTPCGVIFLNAKYNQKFGGGIQTPVDGRLLVLTKIGTGTSGAQSLDEYLGWGNAKSIPAAIETDSTWNGAWQDTRVLGPASDIFREYEAGSLAYWGQWLEMQLFP